MTAAPAAHRLPSVLTGAAILLLLLLVFSHTVALRHMLMGWLIIGLALHCWRRKCPRVPLWAPVSAWLAYTLVAALAWSAAPVMSVRSWNDEAFYPLILFILFHRIGAEGALDRAFLGALCAGMIALALLSVGGYASLVRNVSRQDILYYYPGIGQASTYAVMALPVFALAAIRAELRLRPFALTGVMLCIVVGAVTLNRMFWPAAAVAALLMSYAAKPRWMARHALKLGAGAAGLILVALAGVHHARNSAFLAGPQPQEPAFVEQIEDMVKTDPRPRMWSTWLGFGLEHPWGGVGFGQRVPALYHWSQHSDHPIFRDRNQRSHAHNLFLNAFLQTGVVGVALLCWLIGALAGRFLRARDRQPLAAWAGLALLAAMLLKNATDDFMRDAVAMYFWSLAGWLLAHAERADGATVRA